MTERLSPGLVGRASMTVTDDDLAPALGSGDVAVLGTPRLIALCEEATVAAVAGLLGSELTSVGVRVEFDHLAPSRLGALVECEAILDEVDARRLRFTVDATENGHGVGRGTVIRAVVDRSRFPG